MTSGRKSLVRWLQPKRFIRRQQSFIAIAVAIYLALWAANSGADIVSTLIYTLPLCNLIALVQDYMGFLTNHKRKLESWAIYLAAVLFISIAGVAIVNLMKFPLYREPGQSLWQFLRAGWKFPFMATMIVGISTELYRRMRDRLESKNLELEKTIQRETAERQLQGQELEQAREIQQSLLPKEIPQLSGFEIEGVWEPARVVGGDYFDVIRLSNTRLGICIADVVGKSVSAALLMASVQATVRAFAFDSSSPSVLCSRVNSVLCSTIGTGKFVTFFYGILDSEKRTFHYTNAGHLSPLLIRADGPVQHLENSGAVLGVFPAWKYQDAQFQFRAGDRLLLFTDGITEASLPDGEEFGEQRLIASAQAYRDRSTSELKKRLMSDVKQFCHFRFRDDATLIVISAAGAAKGILLPEFELCNAEFDFVGSGTKPEPK